ncbi:MAG TPA: nuclear transport factor 2 family protein [Gammaproteobacteria bacterium]|nr:nuclear transport factor 2 family protein [Gammaproteobacteria bacterium]
MRTNIALLGAVLAVTGCAPQSDPRLDALVDRQAIDQLVAGDYPRALDAHDWDTYVGYFTEDGELSLGPQTAKGHAEMKKLLEGLGDERIDHVISNLSYRIEGDSATGGAYWEDIGLVNGAPGVIVAGHYDDALRKVDGEWKFSKRTIVIDFMAPAQPAAPADSAGKGDSSETPAEPAPARQ